MSKDFAVIEAVGKAVFGTNWLTPMAEALGRDYRTLTRWRSGDTTLTEEMWDEADITRKLKTLLRDHRQQVQQVQERLRTIDGRGD